MEIYLTDVAVTPKGAAFLSVRSPGANLCGTGDNHALALNPVLTAVRPEPFNDAFRLIPAPTMMPSGNRKQQTNVLKTRISAGGTGLTGSLPEREPQPA